MFNLLFVIFSAVVAYALGRIIATLDSIDQKLTQKADVPKEFRKMNSGFAKRLGDAIEEQNRVQNKITNRKK